MAGTSYVQGIADEPLLYHTIGQAVDHAAAAFGARDAVVSVAQEWRISFAELAQVTDRIAANLLGLGLEPGDRIGIWSHNCMEWTLAQYATAKAGLILVTINPAYRKSELAYALRKVGCRALILAERFKTSDYRQMVLELAPEVGTAVHGRVATPSFPDLELVITLGQRADQGPLPFDALLKEPAPDHKRTLAQVQDGLRPDDPINIQFTSVTTGSPKGATLTHFNILNNGHMVGCVQNLSEGDRVCIPVPLYHCFGMVLGNIACLTNGSAAIFPGEGFEPQAAIRATAEERCTALYGVPAMFIEMLAEVERNHVSLPDLRTGIMAGAPCPIELMRQVCNRMGMGEVTIAYGMTETSPVNFQTRIGDPMELKVSTVGRIHPHVEARVVDGEGQDLPRGSRGELLVRGYSVMQGYWGDEDKTAESIDTAGWMHTGDLATIDNDGYCRIVGRIKDMIIRGGENIYPAEIEDFLYNHRDVAEVAIFGVPDERYGEIVACWIVAKDGASVSDADIRAFCDGQIAHYKVPALVEFVESFPRTVTGKIQKFAMRDTVVKRRQVGAF